MGNQTFSVNQKGLKLARQRDFQQLQILASLAVPRSDPGRDDERVPGREVECLGSGVSLGVNP